MADSQSTNGRGSRPRELALVEIDVLCANMLHDLRILQMGVECIRAEVKEAQEGETR